MDLSSNDELFEFENAKFNQLKEKSKNGDVDALNELGICHYYGRASKRLIAVLRWLL